MIQFSVDQKCHGDKLSSQYVMLEYNCYGLSQNSFVCVLKIFVILAIICLFSFSPM